MHQGKLVFAQLMFRHMGFRCQTISRNTLANANATRPWQIYADFAQHLIGLARPLYATEPFGLELDVAVYAFDASTIVQFWAVASCTYHCRASAPAPTAATSVAHSPNR